MGVNCGFIGAVIIGEDNHLTPRQNAIAIDIGAQGRRQHDTGAIIVGKYQRAFDGTLGQHNLFRADFPEALTGDAIIRLWSQMVGHPLQRSQIVVIVIARHGCARQDGHLFQARQFRQGFCNPVQGRLSVDQGIVAEQRAAHFLLFVGQDDTGTGATCCQSRSNPGGAAPNHKHITESEFLGIGIRVSLHWGLTQSCRTSDNLFIDRRPPGGGEHKGLIVESSRKQLGNFLVHRLHIKLHRRPAILAGGGQPVIQIHHSGAGIGFRARSCFQLNQGIGLFGSGAHNAARAVVFEAAPDQLHAIGQQGRGQRVTTIARVTLPIIGEGQFLAAVQPAFVGQAIGLAHFLAPSANFL